MESSVVVTGGTGTLGGHVVARLRDAGGVVRVLTRRRVEPADGVAYVVGDLATGEGIDAAVEGAGTVVHLAGSATGDADKARNLVRAASRVGVGHLVYISVVGADAIPVVSGVDRALFGYYASKLAAERIVADSGVPWTTLRATQFYDLTLTTVRAMARLPLVPVPSGWRFQPVDSREVAARLVDLASGPPGGLVAAMGGPQVYDMADLVRSYLRASGRRRPIIPLRLPGRAAAAFKGGANLTPDHAVGTRTWDDFLADELHANTAAPTAA